METNYSGGLVIRIRHILISAVICAAVGLFWATYFRFSKIETDIAFLDRANIIQTQVINKQGLAVSALLDKLGMDEDEVLK